VGNEASTAETVGGFRKRKRMGCCALPPGIFTYCLPVLISELASLSKDNVHWHVVDVDLVEYYPQSPSGTRRPLLPRQTSDICPSPGFESRVDMH